MLERVPANVAVPRLPSDVVGGSYHASIPLIRPSRLTTKENGGVGKDLSEGWCLNFAIGCSHACPFCYVQEIHRRFFVSRYGEALKEEWGDYLLVPDNLEDAIAGTRWSRWSGLEAMMSSTHDPYLPVLAPWARKILDSALPAGVRICLQTRSFLVTKDLELLAKYRDQVRLQVSLATMDRAFAAKIEPRVPPPEARIQVLRKARAAGLSIGVILAPIFPACDGRRDPEGDVRALVRALSEIRPDHIYGESVHTRGPNLRLVAKRVGENVRAPREFDEAIASVFHEELAAENLIGTWWPA